MGGRGNPIAPGRRRGLARGGPGGRGLGGGRGLAASRQPHRRSPLRLSGPGSRPRRRSAVAGPRTGPARRGTGRPSTRDNPPRRSGRHTQGNRRSARPRGCSRSPPWHRRTGRGSRWEALGRTERPSRAPPCPAQKKPRPRAWCRARCVCAASALRASCLLPWPGWRGSGGHVFAERRHECSLEGRGADWGPDLQAAGTAPGTGGKVLGWGAAGTAVCVHMAGPRLSTCCTRSAGLRRVRRQRPHLLLAGRLEQWACASVGGRHARGHSAGWQRTCAPC